MSELEIVVQTRRCVECHTVFPIDEMIRHGNIYVCGNCKPRFLQKLVEGTFIPGGLRYAGFWRRFLAQFIDGLMLSIVNVPLQFLFLVPLSRGVESAAALGFVLAVYILQISVGFAYETILIWKYGATVGKMACQVEVVTADGRSLTYLQSVGRYFAKLLSWFTLMIGCIIAAFDPEKRALHDRICNTRVLIK